MKASFIPEYSNPFTLMHSQVALNAKGHLRIQKIGGIDDLSLTFQPGVTVLAGRNATNRTSILRAIMAAFGSDDVSVKGDADTGKVELELGDQTYSRTLTQTSDSIRFSGDPHPVDTTITETFAFLLETNDARQAVLSQQNLRDVIMRPVNTHEIEAEISQLKTERANVESEIDEIESLKGDLPELEQKRTSLKTEIEETRTQLEAKRDELDELDGDVEEKQEQNEKLEAKLDEIRSTRSELEEVRYDLETEQETLKTLANERTSRASRRIGSRNSATGSTGSAGTNSRWSER
jgi:predicted ATP-dependent endonuclease of OLD family